MAEINRMRLRGQLADNYDGLVKKLTRRLGSSDFAYEALHETFLRLERVTDTVPIRSPADYIFRIAINIAKDRQKAQRSPRWHGRNRRAARRRVTKDRARARIVEARSDIDAFRRALAELPARPRDVLYSVAIEGRSPQDVAARLGVSVRTVESDLKLALSHCADCLDYTLIRRLGGPRPRS